MEGLRHGHHTALSRALSPSHLGWPASRPASTAARGALHHASTTPRSELIRGRIRAEPRPHRCTVPR